MGVAVSILVPPQRDAFSSDKADVASVRLARS
jgi:hypothetical protein